MMKVCKWRHSPERQECQTITLTLQWQLQWQSCQRLHCRLDKKIEDLEEEQRKKLDIWNSKVDPLKSWLSDAEATVEAYEPIGYETMTTRRQTEEAQVSVLTTPENLIR